MYVHAYVTHYAQYLSKQRNLDIPLVMVFLGFKLIP